jgi:hypothetical protein
MEGGRSRWDAMKTVAPNVVLGRRRLKMARRNAVEVAVVLDRHSPNCRQNWSRSAHSACVAGQCQNQDVLSLTLTDSPLPAVNLLTIAMVSRGSLQTFYPTSRALAGRAQAPRSHPMAHLIKISIFLKLLWFAI